METQSLIPTRYKRKLPKGFSYSYSASELSGLLSGLAAYPNCYLHFSDRATYWHSEWQKAIREQREVEVLQCIHQPDPGEWDIHVYSVPSQTRQVVRAVLNATAFPALLRWVAAKRGARFSAYFNLESETVRIEHFPP